MVTFLSHEEGGRKHLPQLGFAGFMPHIVVQSPDIREFKVINGVCVDDYLGVRFSPIPMELMIGQPLECEMELMYYPDVNYDAVQEGATFTLREGGKFIGYGVVLKRDG